MLWTPSKVTNDNKKRFLTFEREDDPLDLRTFQLMILYYVDPKWSSNMVPDLCKTLPLLPPACMHAHTHKHRERNEFLLPVIVGF